MWGEVHVGTEAGENQDTGRTDHPKHLQWGQHKRVITNLSDSEKGVFAQKDNYNV